MQRFVRIAITAVLAGASTLALAQSPSEWSPEERELLSTLTLSALSKLAPDPSNKYGDDPRAADLGHRLFFDRRLSSNGRVACATCHEPERDFTDGKPLSVGVGVTPRNAPTVIGAAYNSWFFWDGRKDSQWSQALASIENPLEHDMPRARIIAVIRDNPDLARDFVAIFGPLPSVDDRDGVNRAFANVGKAIAAYERRILPGRAKFDRYVDAVLAGRKPAPADELTLDERQGLHVFLSDQLGRCLRCHSGPLFTNQHFHNLGVAEPGGEGREEGRLVGVETVLADEFNCKGRYSDARPEQCDELTFARRNGPELRGAFKVPTLRNLPKTAPYLRVGNKARLEDAMWHYRNLPRARIGESELNDLPITGVEFDQLEAFLRTLESPIDAPAKYLRSPEPPNTEHLKTERIKSERPKSERRKTN
ncbi:MAG: cytochrome-c peroxidase [Hyphomicrobiales bacterium]|nr:cytochrome-c peroxidase [Hyphomicrobiales bacterium]